MSYILKDGERFRTMTDGSVIVIGRDGRVVDDGDPVLRDGQKALVPLLLMDAAAKPGTTPVTFGTNRLLNDIATPGTDARRQYIDSMSAVKKSELPPEARRISDEFRKQAMAGLTTDRREGANAAYERRSARLNDNWRSGASSQLNSTAQAELAPEFQREADAYARSKATVSNAWRGNDAAPKPVNAGDANAAYERMKRRLEDAHKHCKGA